MLKSNKRNCGIGSYLCFFIYFKMFFLACCLKIHLHSQSRQITKWKIFLKVHVDIIFV